MRSAAQSARYDAKVQAILQSLPWLDHTCYVLLCAWNPPSLIAEQMQIPEDAVRAAIDRTVAQLSLGLSG